MNEMQYFALAREGDKAAKEKIVSENTGLVWSIARRFINRGYDLEEIYQIGCIGLLKAIERFSFDFDVKFSTYAVPLITGEIKRFLRDNGAIKVSRIIKQNGYRISKIREAFINEHGRDITLDELAKQTGLSYEEIVAATEANREVESIYQTTRNSSGDEQELLERVADNDSFIREEDEIYNKMMLDKAMASLDEMQRELIRLRYFQDKTQVEVARELGLTQVQVSRLEKRLLNKMRITLDKKSN